MTNVVTPGLAGTARRAQVPPCPISETRSDRRFSDFSDACARGGGLLALVRDANVKCLVGELVPQQAKTPLSEIFVAEGRQAANQARFVGFVIRLVIVAGPSGGGPPDPRPRRSHRCSTTA